MSPHQGTVAGLLAVIVIIRVVEGGRLPNVWGAVFGGGGAAPAAPAPPAPAAASANPAPPWATSATPGGS